jgi:hypothetical protein
MLVVAFKNEQGVVTYSLHKYCYMINKKKLCELKFDKDFTTLFYSTPTLLLNMYYNPNEKRTKGIVEKRNEGKGRMNPI